MMPITASAGEWLSTWRTEVARERCEILGAEDTAARIHEEQAKKNAVGVQEEDARPN